MKGEASPRPLTWTRNTRSQTVLDTDITFAPSKPIKALLATGQMPHYLTGIREYIARGIPIYAVADTAAMIRRMASAPWRMRPDALARHPREPILRIVAEPTAIGTGPTCLDLLPLLDQYHRLGVILPA